MDYFKPANADNIAGDLDLWLRRQRDQGKPDFIILDTLVVSMGGVAELVREEVMDEIPEYSLQTYDEGFKEGKRFAKSQPIRPLIYAKIRRNRFHRPARVIQFQRQERRAS